MLNVPQEIKDLLHTDSVKKNLRIHFPNGERTDICNDLIVMNSVSFKESLCSQNSFKFGLAESPIFECEVVGVSNIKGATIEVSCEIYCPNTVSGAVWRMDIQQWVYPIEYGSFRVQSCDRQSDLIHRKIVCYSLLNGNEGMINPVTLNIITEGTTSNDTYTPDLMKLAFANIPRNIDLGFTQETLSVSPATSNSITFGSTVKHSTEYSGERSNYFLNIDVAVQEYTIGSGGISEDDLVKINQSIKLTKAFADTLFEAIDTFIDDYYQTYHYRYTKDTFMQWEYIKDSQYGGAAVHLNNIISLFKNGCVQSTKLTKRRVYSDIWTNVYKPIPLPLTDIDMFYAKGIEPGAKLLLFSGTSARVRITQPPDPEVIAPTITWFDKTVTFKEDNPPISLSRIIPPITMGASFDREKRVVQVGSASVTVDRYVPKLNNFDVYRVLDAALELIGCFMNIPRGGNAAIINIKQKFGLDPSNTLYPGEGLKPLAVTGGSIVPSDYQSCWYDEHYILPFGAILIAYKVSGNVDVQQKFYIAGYNDTSDASTYQVYSLTDNMILQNRISTDEEMQAIAGIIGGNIQGVTYMPVKLLGRGLPYVEPGDTFEVFTSANDSVTTIVLSRTLKGEMVLTDEYVSVL